MELEVRVVSGMESCFASLPVSLIQTLQSTSAVILPPVLALELRSLSSASLWHLAWSGSASRSSAIEVAQQVAECISLPDRAQVLVKVSPTLSKAVLVSIEPCSENDWEILELNSDLAENAILKQVGIVYEGMKFPLWLHGHVVVTFIVTSVSPRKPVVQLVPGTEVTVTPKLRKRIGSEDATLNKGQFHKKALLRVQAPTKNVIHSMNFHGLELGVVLTCAIFINPETARNFSLHNSQLVIIMPKLYSGENAMHQKDSTAKSNSFGEKISSDSLLRNKESRHAIVRLLFSDDVAKGHLMLPFSLQIFLRASLHSWVRLRSFDIVCKKEKPRLTLSACRFKMVGKSENSSILSFDSFDSSKDQVHQKSGLSLNPGTEEDKLLQAQEELSFLSGALSKQGRLDTALTRKMEFLICAWITGQLRALSDYADLDVNSMVFARETILQFEVKFAPGKNEQVDSGTFVDKGSSFGGSTAKFFLLSTSLEGSSFVSPYGSFEIPIKMEEGLNVEPKLLNLELGELEAGDTVLLDSGFDTKVGRSFTSSVFSLHWLETALSDAINRILVRLSPYSGKQLSMHLLPFPGHVLIYGPPGSGKTSLTMAIAKYFEEHKEILAHIIFINCSKVAMEKNQSVRQILSSYVSEAFAHSPSVVIFDDLNLIVSTPDFGSPQPLNSVHLTEFLTEVIDEYEEKRHSSCSLGPVAFVASVQTLTSLPKSLTSSGRFDFHVQLPSPAVSEREDILKHEIYKRSLHCSPDILSNVASKCDGYDAYDLEILVDRAVHSATDRYLCSHVSVRNKEKPSLEKDDFAFALKEFTPVAMRGLTRTVTQGARNGWDDVGGLVDICSSIQEMIEMPSKYPSIFAEAPLRLRSNILLYGPPGCGKTHIVGAAASACSLRFISIKGPELLNKYIGSSEQAVRDLFRKAAAASPCLLFFDEFDSIAPKRGHDNTGVTDRVVNQLLTELDGVEALTGVFVFAATSRPDLLDAALLRPGRLDRLLFCDFPSWHERLEILKVLSRKLPLAKDVSLETVASMTEGFSGADLQALLSDAQLASVHELLESEVSISSGKPPIIEEGLLISVASKARPSVSDSEKRRLYDIYNQFLYTKKSVNTQSRDAKGKRATLA